jgi:tRNA A-37 threonylcarbamoyl transferase component Bud32
MDEPPGGRWNVELLTAAEPGRRNRRTIDVAFLVLAALIAAATAVVASTAPDQDADVAQALHTILGWAEPLWRTAFVGALIVAGLIVVAVVVGRRWDLARDVLVALLVVFAVGSVLSGVVQSDWFAVKASLWGRWGFPELRIRRRRCGRHRCERRARSPVPRRRRLRRRTRCGRGDRRSGPASPSEAFGALALGLGAGALVRLVFGTAAAVPPAERVRAALESLGVEAQDVEVSARQRMGAATYVGHDGDGTLNTRVLGQDAQETQKFARRWRLLAYRDPPRSAPIGRLEQVEHEALATLMAAQAGVRVPAVVTAALGPDGDALIVTRQPDVEPLEHGSATVDDELLRQVWEQAARLHAAGISHGRLNLSNVVVVDGEPVLTDFSAATLGAPRSALDIDVAELLVACTVLAGPDRALRAAVDGAGIDAVVGAMPYLQPAALTPHVRDLARTHEVALKELRGAAAEAAGVKAPAVVPLHRVRPRDLLLTALVIVAAYGLISQLADIGFDTIADQLGNAEVAWIVLALIIAQLTFVAQGVALRGSVLTPLPLLPCVVLQSAIKFINATVPSSAGRIGMNVRFLQQMGAEPGRQWPQGPSTMPQRRSCRSWSCWRRSRSSTPASIRATSA